MRLLLGLSRSGPHPRRRIGAGRLPAAAYRPYRFAAAADMSRGRENRRESVAAIDFLLKFSMRCTAWDERIAGQREKRTDGGVPIYGSVGLGELDSGRSMPVRFFEVANAVWREGRADPTTGDATVGALNPSRRLVVGCL
jgi:hypothetical protein